MVIFKVLQVVSNRLETDQFLGTLDLGSFFKILGTLDSKSVFVVVKYKRTMELFFYFTD